MSTLAGQCFCRLVFKLRNEAKFFIRDQLPKAAICLYGFDNELMEEEEFRKPYNQLYFYSDLRTDTELATIFGNLNAKSHLSKIIEGDKDLPDDIVTPFNDGLILSNASSFYRKSGGFAQGIRHLLYECLAYPTLNIFNYAMHLRSQRDQDFLDYPTVMDCLYYPEQWEQQRGKMRYLALGEQGKPTFNGWYSDSSPAKKVCKSISEIYTLQTHRKEFEALPPLQSNKMRVSALEGFKLGPTDLIASHSMASKDSESCSLDVQGATVNNPAQVNSTLHYILSKTVQKGYYDSLISIDVDRSLVEEYRESLLEIEEFNKQVMVENL